MLCVHNNYNYYFSKSYGTGFEGFVWNMYVHVHVYSPVGAFGGHKNSTFYVKTAISPEGR